MRQISRSEPFGFTVSIPGPFAGTGSGTGSINHVVCRRGSLSTGIGGAAANRRCCWNGDDESDSSPSTTVYKRPVWRFENVCLRPEGHCTSTCFAVSAAPSPKYSFFVCCDKNAEPACTNFI